MIALFLMPTTAFELIANMTNLPERGKNYHELTSCAMPPGAAAISSHKVAVRAETGCPAARFEPTLLLGVCTCLLPMASVIMPIVSMTSSLACMT